MEKQVFALVYNMSPDVPMKLVLEWWIRSVFACKGRKEYELEDGTLPDVDMSMMGGSGQKV